LLCEGRRRAHLANRLLGWCGGIWHSTVLLVSALCAPSTSKINIYCKMPNPGTHDITVGLADAQTPKDFKTPLPERAMTLPKTSQVIVLIIFGDLLLRHFPYHS
jgi:hypothetical protein